MIDLHRRLHATPEGISEEISPNDAMFANGNRAHYFGAGQSALEAIRLAMLVARMRSASRILDFGSGYGRVLRSLRAEFPEAEIYACERDEEGTAFCTSHFSAIPITPDLSLSRLDIEDDSLDIVWVGSVFTHLNATAWEHLLELLLSKLQAGGLLVFTTHGRFVEGRLSSGRYDYGLTEDRIALILRDYRRAGFGYADYQTGVDYGISLSTPSWVADAVVHAGLLELLSFTERGWNEHQDIVACRKRSELGELEPHELVTSNGGNRHQ